MVLNIIFVAIGGSIGATLRFLIDRGISNRVKHHIPFGTLGVNLIGLFIIGFSYSIVKNHIVPTHFALFLITGFLGALTTFSSYALHTFRLFEQGHYRHGINYILLNNFLGIAIAFLGATIGNLI
jgi:CrcB protein